MTYVEVRDGPVLLGVGRVEDLGEGVVTGERRGAVGAATEAFGVGAQIDRLAEGVAYIGLKTLLHGMAHDDLSGVVAGCADGSLGRHGAVLVGVVAVMGGSATRI